MDYNKIAEKLIGKMSKTDIMAFILSLIIDECKINKNQYMIIAGYCLKNFRDVGDLDVIISISEYEKIKKLNKVLMSKAKISNDERIVINLQSLGDDVEIEFFPKKIDEGFPSDYFSIQNLNNKKKLVIDDFGNPYFNLETCVKLYSDVKINNGDYYVGKFKINKDRVEKNLNHLKIIKKNMKNITPKYLSKGILQLKKIL